MDEAVWVVIGVISAIIGVSVIINLLANSDLNEANLESAVNLLSAQCEQVCKLPENSALSVDVKLPKDVILYTEEGRVCISGDELFCGRCSCDHEQEVVLNLTGAPFSSYTFTCRYTRVDTRNIERRVSLACQG